MGRFDYDRDGSLENNNDYADRLEKELNKCHRKQLLSILIGGVAIIPMIIIWINFMFFTLEEFLAMPVLYVVLFIACCIVVIVAIVIYCMEDMVYKSIIQQETDYRMHELSELEKERRKRR